MKKPKWHTEGKPSLLCGHEVTPEGWTLGIVERDGIWVFPDKVWVSYSALKQKPTYCITIGDVEGFPGCVPIYPPRGWHGLSEAEIWIAKVGALSNELILHDECPYMYIDWRGNVVCSVPTEVDGEGYVQDLAALIQALQNARVLSERLKESKNITALPPIES